MVSTLRSAFGRIENSISGISTWQRLWGHKQHNHLLQPQKTNQAMMTSACAPWSRTRNNSWRSETVKVKHFGSLGIIKICCIGFWYKSLPQNDPPKWTFLPQKALQKKIQHSTLPFPFHKNRPRRSLQILRWLRAHQGPGLCLWVHLLDCWIICFCFKMIVRCNVYDCNGWCQFIGWNILLACFANRKELFLL